MWVKIRSLLVVELLMFLGIYAAVFYSTTWLVQQGVSVPVVQASNMLLFILTVAATLMHGAGVNSTDGYVFYRMVMLATFLKLFIAAMAVVLYVVQTGKQKNVPAVYVAMALYMVYTVVEVTGALLLANKRDA